MGTHALRTAIAMLLCTGILSATGCSDDAPPSALGPEASFKAFFNAAWLHAQDQFPSDQKKAYEMLDLASREALKSRASALSLKSPEAPPIAPHELLVVASLPLGMPIQRMEIVDQNESTATLKILFSDGEANALMVREGGRWRVSLARSPESGQ